MSSDDFKVGEKIKMNVYEYDEEGLENSRLIKGLVHQITKYFVVVDNGFYKECFAYNEFEREKIS